MKVIKAIRGAAVAALVSVLAGCMSMEEKLASDDPFWRDIGETEAVGFVLDGTNPLEKRLAIVPKIANQQKLAKIVVAKRVTPEVKAEARKRIDETPALAAVALEAPDKSDQLDALRQIMKREDSRIEAVWIFAERKPSSNAPQTLLKGLSDDGRAKFAQSFTSRIEAATAASKEAEKFRRKYGDAMAKGKLKELKNILKSLVALAPCMEDEKTIELILQRQDIADVKGTEYDFLTPLAGAYQRAVAERKARERAAFLAALTDDERVALLERGRLTKQGKTVVAVDGSVSLESETTGRYEISRKDVLAGVKDADTAKMMAKKEAKRELDKAVASKMKVLDGMDAADRIEAVKNAKDGEFREELARKVLAKYGDDETFQGVLPLLPTIESTQRAYAAANGFLKGQRMSKAKAEFVFGMVADEEKRGELDAEIVKICESDFTRWDSLKGYLSSKVDVASTEAKIAELRRQAIARAEAERARQEELRRQAAARRAELRRQAIAKFIENAKRDGAVISANRLGDAKAKEAIADRYKGKALLFKGAGVWNANCGKPFGDTSDLYSGKDHYTLLTTSSGDTFYCAFAEQFAAKPKTFKNFQDEKFTLFVIVTGDKRGFTYCTVGGLVEDENDVKGMEKIIEVYGVNPESGTATTANAGSDARTQPSGRKATTGDAVADAFIDAMFDPAPSANRVGNAAAAAIETAITDTAVDALKAVSPEAGRVVDQARQVKSSYQQMTEDARKIKREAQQMSNELEKMSNELEKMKRDMPQLDFNRP